MAVDVDLTEAFHASFVIEQRLATIREEAVRRATEILAQMPSAQKAGDFQELCRDYAANMQDVATQLRMTATTLKVRA